MAKPHYKIVIEDEVRSMNDAIEVLKEVVRQMQQGYTSGRGGPVWDFVEVEGGETGPESAQNEATGGAESGDGSEVEIEGQARVEGSQEATDELES